ncbi:hypothetical protein ACFSQJ_06735 [Croceitalea marina]|uniref:Uncharacterized protein n=1 Tax=Croceitalea marina TaxID=1775166 RepID=A0ABW5MU05_9FLAO
MKKKIDWLNHSLEFFVVLIGILIAFQLNKCSDNQARESLIENHLSQIRYECQENAEKLDLSIEQITVQIQNCDSLLSEISNGQRPKKIRDLATKLLDLRNMDISTNAYNVLVQSGDIRFLNNYNKKRKVISLYEDFKSVAQINTSNQNLYDNHFYPYIKTNFDLVNWNKVNADSENDKKLYYSREFANTVSTYRFLLVSKKRIYLNQKTVIDKYLSE